MTIVFLTLLVGLCLGLSNEFVMQERGKSLHIRVRRDVECFRRLGCFSNDPPYNNTGGLLPLDPGEIQTTFYLFTRINPTQPNVISRGGYGVLAQSNFSPTKQTTFIIHGFMQHAQVEWVINMTSALLVREDMNVVVVDWGEGSGFPYTQAAANTRVVGAEVAGLIQYMIDGGQVSASRIHLIGHSLGAHVSGYAGQRVSELGRITGLDPAELTFQNMDATVRLDPSDAKFVDVIHTDGSAYRTVSGYGMSQAVGHMDYYPNGGVQQPGCPPVPWIEFVTGQLDLDDIGDTLSCSHSRAIALFTESINSQCAFTAYPCMDSLEFSEGRCLSCYNRPCPSMGYDSVTYKSRGSFYLNTHAETPYCGRHYYVSITTGLPMRYATGQLFIQLIGTRGTSEKILYGERRTYVRGRTYTDMLLAVLEIGHLNEVRLRFQSHHFFSWGSSEITVDRLVITSGKTGESDRFCTQASTVGGGQYSSFPRPSFSSDCATGPI